jgi:hypothetical protein
MLRRLYIPLHLLILVPLLALALPLAIFAVITIALALLTLFARLIIVYLDLTLALLTSWIPPLLPSPAAARKHRSRASTRTSPRPAFPAAFATAAAAAGPAGGAGAATPSSPRLSRRTSRSDSHVSVVLGLGAAPDRDYEGVGGWRLVDDGGPAGFGGDPDDDDDDAEHGGDEATWVGWSSRLEAPASGAALARRRSLTGSTVSATATAPLDRACRGPAAAGATGGEREDDGGYFGQTYGLKRPASGITTTSLDNDEVNHHDFSKS